MATGAQQWRLLISSIPQEASRLCKNASFVHVYRTSFAVESLLSSVTTEDCLASIACGREAAADVIITAALADRNESGSLACCAPPLLDLFALGDPFRNPMDTRYGLPDLLSCLGIFVISYIGKERKISAICSPSQLLPGSKSKGYQLSYFHTCLKAVQTRK